MQDFHSTSIHSPETLKTSLITHLNALLDPVRNHFATDPHAKKLLEQVHSFKRNAPPCAKLSKNRYNVCPAPEGVEIGGNVVVLGACEGMKITYRCVLGLSGFLGFL